MITEGTEVSWISGKYTGGVTQGMLIVKKYGFVLEINGDIATVVYGKNRRRIKIAVNHLKELEQGND